jgi:hypothetical protein
MGSLLYRAGGGDFLAMNFENPLTTGYTGVHGGNPVSTFELGAAGGYSQLISICAHSM